MLIAPSLHLTYLGSAVHGDEIRVVFCHDLCRKAFVYRSLEETQTKATLHTERLLAAAKLSGTKLTANGDPFQLKFRGSSNWCLFLGGQAA